MLRLVFVMIVVPLVLTERFFVRSFSAVAATFAFGPRLGERRLLSPTRVDPMAPAGSYRRPPERPHVTSEALPDEVELREGFSLRRLGDTSTWVAFTPKGLGDLFLSMRSEGDEVVLRARRVVSPSAIVLAIGVPAALATSGVGWGPVFGVGAFLSALAFAAHFAGLIRARRIAQAGFDEIEDALADMDGASPEPEPN